MPRRAAPEMPGRHRQHPPLPGPRTAPGSPDPPGCRPARRPGGGYARRRGRLGRDARRAGGIHDRGRHELRGRRRHETGAIPISAALLAEGVLRSMPLTRLIVAAIGLFAVTLFTAGIGWLAAGSGRPRSTHVRRRSRSTPQAAAPAKADGNGRDAQTDAFARMTHRRSSSSTSAPAPLRRLCHRLLGQHGHAPFARRGEARVAGEPGPAHPRCPVRRHLL